MHGDEKNLRDSSSRFNISLKDTPFLVSYTKTNKLITALYMVTDIMDSGEPLRLRLRTLGVEILSDTYMSKTVFGKGKVEQIISLLDIAFTMNMISEMNKNILVNEFTKLKNSLTVPQDNPMWLEEFLSDSPLLESDREDMEEMTEVRGKHISIGVQKGSTLLKALKDNLSDVGRPTSRKSQNLNGMKKPFDELKAGRRDNIIQIIKTSGGGATIKDIKANTTVQGSALHKASEKTVQRELMSMTKDGVLKKTGSKRWTQYFLS